MKGSQLIQTSEDESRSISVEPVGTELAPTVQVSLAKRILHPGTNKVVCLAAQTTVPLDEDELASVSDLALRLSDGTNVRLSMSFFNEALCPGGFMQNMGRKTYDPDRYETFRAPDESWRLWLVFAGICALTLGGFFYFAPGGFERSAARIVAVLPPIALPRAMTAPPPQKASNTKAKVQPKKSTIENRKSKRSNTTPGQSFRSARKSNRSADSFSEYVPPKAPRSSSGSKTILVPPPPPTMAFPLSQMQLFGYAPYTVPELPPSATKVSQPAKPKAAAKPALFTGSLPAASASPKQKLPPFSSILPTISAPRNSEQRVQTADSSNISSIDYPKPAPAQQRSSARNIFTDVDVQPVSDDGAGSNAAPVPGGNGIASNGPLERIVLP